MRRIAAIALVAMSGVWPFAEENTVTVHFAAAVGIHEGSDVRVLGVKIGEVTSVTPQGRTVEVRLRYDRDVPIPAAAGALIVPPSVVSDRYVQLAPAYVDGPTLADGATLPVERTAVPIELDQIYSALDKLNVAMKDTNSEGALSRLVKVGAANMQGNGAALQSAIDGLSKSLSTLSDGRKDLFGTVANLQEFTTMLARSDTTVREFNTRMAEVSEQLAAEREELAEAVRTLGAALRDVTVFVKQNRAALKDNVAALADITGVLVRQQKAIKEILDVAPLALSNLNLSYNPASGTTDTRDNATGPYDPAQFVCRLLAESLPPAQLPPVCKELP